MGAPRVDLRLSASAVDQANSLLARCCHHAFVSFRRSRILRASGVTGQSKNTAAILALFRHGTSPTGPLHLAIMHRYFRLSRHAHAHKRLLLPSTQPITLLNPFSCLILVIDPIYRCICQGPFVMNKSRDLLLAVCFFGIDFLFQNRVNSMRCSKLRMTKFNKML